MHAGARASAVVWAGLMAVACAGAEELSTSADSGAKTGGAGGGGTGGATHGAGGSGAGATTTTAGGGAGGVTSGGGSGPATGTGTGGSSGTSGGTGTGGTGTGGAGGSGGVHDAGAGDDRPNTVDAGACTACKLRVQYRASDTNAGDNQIKPHFNIVNVGTTSVALSELTIRYWYTADGNRPEVYWCDYAMIGCSNVTGRFVKLAQPEQGADSYLEIGFSRGAGTLSASGQSGEIQNRINKDDYSNYDETDDYSFDPARTAFGDWMRVTLYHNGGLVWGIDPACANPRDGSTCSDDAGADASDGQSDVSSDTGAPDVARPDIATDSSSTSDAGSTDSPSGNDAAASDGTVSDI